MSLSESSEPSQNRLPAASDFCSCFYKEQRTQSVIVHGRRRSPEAGLSTAFHDLLSSVPIRSYILN